MPKLQRILWYPTLLRLSMLLLLSPAAFAEPAIRVVGLFSGAAVVSIDGQRHMLRIGQPGPQGIALLAADSTTATLRINGQTRQFGMQRDYSDGFAPRQTTQVSIPRGAGGHYRVTGSINGQTVPFMVDTGATSVAMSSVQARRLGIDYRVTGAEVRATTASGQVAGYRVKLDRVKVGDLELANVDGLILEGSFPAEVLLGNSYLKRIRMVDQRSSLILESR